MKFALLVLLFSTVSFASEIQTSLTESRDGLSFSVYEVASQSEAAPLAQFAHSLNQTTMITTDQNFSFKCVSRIPTKALVETRCTGILRDSTHPNATGTFGDDFISITLTGKAAEEFFGIFPKQYDTVSINLENKLILVGSGIHFGIMVRH